MTQPFDLTDLDELSGYADTDVPDTSDAVPDGTYTAYVDHVELTRTKTDKRRLAWRLKIIGPNHIGRCVFSGHMLETPQNLQWLKRDLKTCGIELAAWSELPRRLADLLDLVLEVQVKTKGDFTNCYFRKRVELADGVNPRELAASQQGGNSMDATAALFSDDIPF